MTTSDVDEATILVIIAVLVDVCFKRTNTRVRPLVLRAEHVRARVVLRECNLARGRERRGRHGTALYKIFRLAVRIHTIQSVVIVAPAMSVDARLPRAGFVQVVAFEITVHVVWLAGG